MAEYTTNLNLEKPAGGENIRRQTLNDNAEKIDQKFGIGAGAGHSHNGVAGQGTKISFNDLNDKPSAMAPTIHKSSHAAGGGDALTPADIGAETPSGAQAKADAVQGNLTAHINDMVNVQLPSKADKTTTDNLAKHAFSHFYNVDNALLKYRMDLNETRTGIVHGAYLGDSIVSGTNSSDPLVTSAAARLRSMLQAKYGACGEGFIDIIDSRFMQTGTWMTNGINGVNCHYHKASGSGHTKSLVFTGVAFDIVHAKYTTGGFANVTVDGVAQTQLNSYAVSTYFGNLTKYSGFNNAEHTITITTVSGDTWIEGIIIYTASTGIMLHRLGVPSQQSSVRTDIRNMNGLNNLHISFLIVELGVNDCNLNIGTTQFYNNMKAVLGNISGTKASIILQINNTATYQNMQLHWDEYVPVYYTIADELNCAVFDVHKIFDGSYEVADALGYYGTNHDPIHPGDKGYNMIAMELNKIL